MKVKEATPAVKSTKSDKDVEVSPSGYVQLEHIVNADDLHYRKVNGAFVEELVLDISSNGLDTPINTWGGGEEQEEVKIDGNVVPVHYLVAGLHRRAALVKLKRTNAARFKELFPAGIPVIHRLGTVADMLALQVRENVQRRDMEPEEIFPVLKELSETHGLKNREIAKKIGKSDAWVSQMLAVNTELDDETKAEVMEGKIGITKAAKIATDVVKAKKAGKTVTTADIREKAAAAKAAKGDGERSVKRMGIQKFLARYKAFPAINVGRRIVLLENMLNYVAGETDKLEPEWKLEDKTSKVKPAAAKPSAVKAAAASVKKPAKK